MSLNNLEELFTHLLQDMYNAEHQILKALPEMSEKCQNEKLRMAFKQHREETQGQINKLDEVFDLTGLDKSEEECQAMQGIIDEGEQMIGETGEGPTRDSALIVAAQKVEHYEIATYGSLASIARKLDHTDAADILHAILEEEKETDQKLTDLSGDIEMEAMDEAA